MYRIEIVKYIYLKILMLNIPERISILSDWAIVITNDHSEIEWFNTFEQAGMVLEILDIAYVFN